MAEARPFIDLRSDTVTRPTAAMRRAIAEAEAETGLVADDPVRFGAAGLVDAVLDRLAEGG